MAEKSGPETYAPPERRPPEKRSDAERIAFLRQQRGEAAPAIGRAAEDLKLAAGHGQSSCLAPRGIGGDQPEVLRAETDRLARSAMGQHDGGDR